MGPCDDDAGRSRQTLHETQQDERPHRRGDDAEDRGHGIGRHADEERTAAAQGIAEWAGEHLAQGESEQAGAQGKLRLGGARPQVAAEGG